MKLLIEIIIGYLTLYIVIWSHEIGHSFFYWKYGCKDNWLKVNVKPYLFFSTPAPINEKRALELGATQSLLIYYGGIAVNLLLAFIFLAAAKAGIIHDSYLKLFIYQFITLNLSEAISYLILGNIYLVSDMKAIAEIKPILRFVNFIFGIFISIIYFIIISQLPRQVFSMVIISNLIVIICMGVGRIAFTFYFTKH